MRIITYNLHFGGKTTPNNPWQRMLDEFHPDIVFAQESFHPSQYFSPETFSEFKTCLHKNVDHGRWGSAIVSRHLPLEEIHLDMPEFEGWVICARAKGIQIGDLSEPVLFLNVHAPSRGNYEILVTQLIEAIVEKFPGEKIVMGGDFNLTTAIRQENEELQNTKGELAILKHIENGLGLINTWQTLHPCQPLPQTLRWNNKPLTPYHCDAIYIPKCWSSQLLQAEIINHGDWDNLSDHKPIVANVKSNVSCA
jgi:exonuclease III